MRPSQLGTPTLTRQLVVTCCDVPVVIGWDSSRAWLTGRTYVHQPPAADGHAVTVDVVCADCFPQVPLVFECQPSGQMSCPSCGRYSHRRVED